MLRHALAHTCSVPLVFWSMSQRFNSCSRFFFLVVVVFLMSSKGKRKDNKSVRRGDVRSHSHAKPPARFTRVATVDVHPKPKSPCSREFGDHVAATPRQRVS